MRILISAPSDRLIKCTCCGEIGSKGGYHPIEGRDVCDRCIKYYKIISLLDWQAYQLMNAYKSRRKYLVLAAEKLDIPVKQMRAISCRLARKGLKIVREPKPKKVVTVKHKISAEQQRILDVIMRQDNLINSCYVEAAAKELGVDREKVDYHIERLRGKGFNIPTKTQRAANLKKYILEQMQTTQKSRADFIKSLAKETGLSAVSIRLVVAKHEREKGIYLNKGTAPEAIEELVLNEGVISLKHLYSAIPFYSRRSLLYALRTLKNQGRIIISGNNRERIKIEAVCRAKTG
ncbi:hypothetical protein [Aulosira sp. FACHB-615]|uniref:hypothetical protein n=1 Tax=Aulosira sp. FACHB-615 TaxID=2692777 RepID=UPI00168896E5|nr:hypothetical protein [Aulosira sp. FACHB-615]MBD2492619.1 hypothetical protein [Aulosira sp. FACHB-615]